MQKTEGTARGTAYHTADEIRRLGRSLEHAFNALEPVRKQREELLKATTGTDYIHSRDGSEIDQMLDLMGQAEQAFVMTLAAERPRVKVTARSEDRVPFAEKYQKTINRYSEEANLRYVLQECVRNSWSGLGIAYVYNQETVPVREEIHGLISEDRPIADVISPHDFVYDTEARATHFCSFMGHRYETPLDEIVGDPQYSKEVQEKCKNLVIDRTAKSKTVWGKSMNTDADTTFRKYVWMADIFIPHEQVIYTFLVDERFCPVLANPIVVTPWEGREAGPYHFLNLGPVADKIEPVPPALRVLKLHDSCNSLYKKLFNQSDRQKQVVIGGSEDYLESLRSAEDGDYVPNVTTAEFERVEFDGPNNQLLGMVMNMQQLFNQFAGNPAHMLGLGESAGTLGQERMIAQNASNAASHNSGIYATFVRELVQDLADRLFDSEVTMDLSEEVPDTGVVLEDEWPGRSARDERYGESGDYGVDVDPYSMGYRSPGERLRFLDETFDRVAALAPFYAEQGKFVDPTWYLQRRAELGDEPDMAGGMVKDIPQDPGPPTPGGGGGMISGMGPRQPYEHVSLGNGSGSGQGPSGVEAQMSQMGQGSSGGESSQRV